MFNFFVNLLSFVVFIIAVIAYPKLIWWMVGFFVIMIVWSYLSVKNKTDKK